MVAAANDTARMLAAGGIRYRHPEWSEGRIQQEVARECSMRQIEFLRKRSISSSDLVFRTPLSDPTQALRGVNRA